jgi:hypothetical protein
MLFEKTSSEINFETYYNKNIKYFNLFSILILMNITLLIDNNVLFLFTLLIKYFIIIKFSPLHLTMKSISVSGTILILMVLKKFFGIIKINKLQKVEISDLSLNSARKILPKTQFLYLGLVLIFNYFLMIIPFIYCNLSITCVNIFDPVLNINKANNGLGAIYYIILLVITGIISGLDIEFKFNYKKEKIKLYNFISILNSFMMLTPLVLSSIYLSLTVRFFEGNYIFNAHNFEKFYVNGFSFFLSFCVCQLLMILTLLFRYFFEDDEFKKVVEDISEKRMNT